MSGTIGGLVATYIVERFGIFVAPLRILLVVSMVGMVLLVFANSLAMYIGFAIIAGIGLVGFVPMAIEGIMEQGYPIRESVSNNAIF